VESRRAQLPASLRAFLYSCIDSIEQLELLMLLKDSREGRTARELAQEVGIPDGRARAYLQALAARGLAHVAVSQENRYSFRPASEALAGYCNELSNHLRDRRSDVLRFVSTLPPPAVRSFANAFKLRESED
jgi:hypothetical protein